MKRFFVIGTGNACKEALRIIDAHDKAEVAGLATIPDDALAAEKKYPLFLIDGNKDTLVREIQKSGADVLLSVVSPVVLPREALNSVSLAVNLHPGLLPHYTGFYTHLWAIINGETEFGVTLHKMEDKIDSGAVYGEERFSIRPEDTGIKVYMNCVKASGKLISRFIDELSSGAEIHYTELDLSKRRNYKRSELEQFFIVPEEVTTEEAFRAYRAHQFKPFTSPVGDLKMKLNGEIHSIQKMTLDNARILSEYTPLSSEDTIIANTERAVTVKFRDDGYAKISVIDNQPAMLALGYNE